MLIEKRNKSSLEESLLVSILQQIFTDMANSFGLEAMKLFEGQSDFGQLVIDSKKIFDNSLCQLFGEVLSDYDQQIMSSAFRRQFYRVKDKRERRIDTSVGTVNYTRRYYEDKRSNELFFLLDEAVGIEKNSRLSMDLRAKLLEDAAQLSYRQAAKRNGGNSTQSASTVMNVVHRSGGVITAEDQLGPEVRNAPPVLFVEADEDHVAHQDGTNHFLKMVYVHEGYEPAGSHKYRLKHPFYVVGEYPGAEGTEEIWRTTLDCIEKRYGGHHPQRFFLAGDGAQWIKSGAEYLSNCTVVYDKFHLKKVCKQAATGIGGDLGKTLEYWALQGHSSYLKEYFKVRLNDPSLRSSEYKAVNQARLLIQRNWKAIKANNDSDFHGCSAEGHVSHMLSERFSSRPMGWCQLGTDSLSQTRVFVLKGGNVFEKLQKHAHEEKQITDGQRVDARLKMNYNVHMAKYASTASAQLVEQNRGIRRAWQYGVTH